MFRHEAHNTGVSGTNEGGGRGCGDVCTTLWCTRVAITERSMSGGIPAAFRSLSRRVVISLAIFSLSLARVYSLIMRILSNRNETQ